MRLRRRDQPADAEQLDGLRRHVAAKDTALFRGAMLEIAQKDAELARLRALLFAHGIDYTPPADG